MRKILVVQTAFIGDVVLATGLLEKLHAVYPDAVIDILVRGGNENLFRQHPFLHEALVWEKRSHKYRNLFSLISRVRKNKYELLINVQRFAATGLITVLSGAGRKIGFDKNPFSFLFSDIIRHVVSEGAENMHEVQRNHQLIRSITDDKAAMPRLYPAAGDFAFVEKWKSSPYICVAPASVWFTKQFPADQWAAFTRAVPPSISIYLIGAPGDNALCEQVRSVADRGSVVNLAGQLNFLQSAALQKDALMNYVNDSAPMHFASAVDAPVTAVYCSTIPAFGFGPLSTNSHIVEIAHPLACRPCGLHGRSACPLSHFNCARHIETAQLLATLPQ
jgi:heptosyltransferase-2